MGTAETPPIVEGRGMSAASVAMPDPPEGWEDYLRLRSEIRSGTVEMIPLGEALRLIDDKQARQRWLDSRLPRGDVRGMADG
jgi:hypothetical protein